MVQRAVFEDCNHSGAGYKRFKGTMLEDCNHIGAGFDDNELDSNHSSNIAKPEACDA